MKLQSLLLVLTVVSATGVLSAQSAYDLFVKEFDQAMKFANKDGVSKAIRGRPAQAITHFEALLVSELRSQKAEQYRASLDSLRDGFKAAFEVDTMEHVERYYRSIDADVINKLHKAEENRTKLYNEWLKLKTARDRKGILEIVEQGMQLGRYLEELGHKLKAADVYSTIASFVNDIPNHTDQDTRDTIDYAKMFMAMRDSWSWNKDSMYLQWRNWVAGKQVALADSKKEEEKRKKAGLATSADGLAKFVDTKADSVIGKLEFQALKALDDDSCFLGGPIPINWLSVQITKAPAKLEWFKKRDVYLVRDGTKVGVSLTGKAGDEYERVTTNAKLKPSLIHLDPQKKEPYSIVFFVGGEAEPFASTTSNLAPTQESMNVYFRSAASWTARIQGEDVVFFDDNCDGQIFTTDPMAYGYKTRLYGLGPEEEVPVPVYDSMKVGKKGPVIPFSNVLKVGDKWFLLSLVDKGTAVEAKPLHPEFFKTGTVSMKWSGSRAIKPQLVIIRGKDDLQSTAFNIAEAKPVEVPVGEYRIDYGRSTKGKGGQTQMVNIFPGDSATIKVEAGKNTVVKMGAPFRFDFKKAGDENEVVIDSLFFQIKGVGGEVYGKIQGPTPAPEVVVAKSSSGKGAKVVGQYVPITSPEMLNTASQTLTDALGNKVRGMGINVGFFPVVKGERSAPTVLKFKPPFPGALVGLRVKKHKMFGKIDPIYK